MALHNLQELDDNLGGGSDEDLTLTALLSVGKDLEAVSEGVDEHHFMFFCVLGLGDKPKSMRKVSRVIQLPNHASKDRSSLEFYNNWENKVKFGHRRTSVGGDREPRMPAKEQHARI